MDRLDRGDRRAPDALDWGLAGSCRRTIDMDGAGAALRNAASCTLVPVIPSTSRMTQSSGVSPSTSTLRCSPLTLRSYAMNFSRTGCWGRTSTSFAQELRSRGMR